MNDSSRGPLPEGAAGWLVRAWGNEVVLVDRWAARDRLARIEQLHRIHGTVDEVAVLDPADDDGFAETLAEWTRLVPWSVGKEPAAVAPVPTSSRG